MIKTTIAAAFAAILTVGVAFAADTPGVTATELKIGNTSPYSGPASTYGARDATGEVGRQEMGTVRGCDRRRNALT